MSDKTKAVRATTSVRLTIEVPASGNWQPSEPIERIHREAGDGAVNRVRMLFVKDGTGMKIIGEPHVVSVLAEYDR